MQKGASFYALRPIEAGKSPNKNVVSSVTIGDAVRPSEALIADVLHRASPSPRQAVSPSPRRRKPRGPRVVVVQPRPSLESMEVSCGIKSSDRGFIISINAVDRELGQEESSRPTKTNTILVPRRRPGCR